MAREPVQGHPLPACVILLTGVMAAGKSAVADRMAAGFPCAAHVRGDVFRRFVVTGRREPRPDMDEESVRQLMLRYRLAVAAAVGYAEAGFVAVVQDVVVGPVLRDVARMISFAPTYLVVLDPDAAAVERRERQRPKRGYVDGWQPARLVDDLRTTTPRLGLWIDTTDLSVPETVTTILAGLDRARLADDPVSR